MKPLKVLVYKANVTAVKQQGNTPEVQQATLVKTEFGTNADEVGCIVFDTGLVTYYPLSYLEVLPGQFDSETIIELDVPGAINNALNPDSL